MQVTVLNKSAGLRVFKNAKGADITIQAGDSRTFDMHPHHLRILAREAEKKDAKIAIDAADDDLETVKKPGVLMTELEKRAQEEHELNEQRRLQELRRTVQGEAVVVDKGRFITDPKTVDQPQPQPLGEGRADIETIRDRVKKLPKLGPKKKVDTTDVSDKNAAAEAELAAQPDATVKTTDADKGEERKPKPKKERVKLK